MSFQEFASKLFGGRDELENVVKDAKRTKKADERVKQFKESFEGDRLERGEKIKELQVDESTRKNKRQLSKANKLFEEAKYSELAGFADKNSFGRTPREGKGFEEVPIIGDKRAENEERLVVDSPSGPVTFEKSQFDKFESRGSELSESKEEKAENIMESRSERAQRTDRRNAAPIADSFEEWKKSPSQTDLPGIDTLGSGDDLDDIL